LLLSFKNVEKRTEGRCKNNGFNGPVQYWFIKVQNLKKNINPGKMPLKEFSRYGSIIIATA